MQNNYILVKLNWNHWLWIQYYIKKRFISLDIREATSNFCAVSLKTLYSMTPWLAFLVSILLCATEQLTKHNISYNSSQT